MTDPAPREDEREHSSALGKAFGIFVWVFVLGTAAVTIFYIVLFIMWGMSV